MALKKKDEIFPLLVHCSIYSITVYLCLLPELINLNWKYHIISLILIFISHIILDGTYIIDFFYNWTKGRSWDRSIEKLSEHGFNSEMSIYLSYTAIVQTVSDNIIHIILMVLGFSILF